MARTKMKLWVKIVCIVLAAIVAVFATLALTVVGVWHNEISTLNSFKQLQTRNDDNKEGSV